MTTTTEGIVGDAGALRRRVRGWMMFDWASQPFYTLLLTFIFGPYFAAVVADSLVADGLAPEQAKAGAQRLWSGAQTVIGVAIAVAAPLMGALADRAASKMTWIVAFSAAYVVGTAGVWVMVPDASQTTLALGAFALAMIGAEMTTLFTNAMLPGLAPRERVGRISGTGYAMGYAGGVLSLAVMLALFADNADGRTFLGGDPALGLDGAAREGTRAVGPFSALWYVIFMIPFFAWVREPRLTARPLSLRGAAGDVMALLRQLPGRPSLTAFLAGSMLYRDALVALYSFGGVYATLVLDWETTQIGIFGIVGAVTAAVASYLGGRLDGRFGPKPVIVGAVCILTGVLLVICFTSREMVVGLPIPEGSGLPDVTLYVMGALIGGAGGVTQAASRTMMVRHADPDGAGEAFGLYALAGKATAFLAPALIWLGTTITDSARLGYLPVALLFVAGLVLLRWVDPEGDRR